MSNFQNMPEIQLNFISLGCPKWGAVQNTNFCPENPKWTVPPKLEIIRGKRHLRRETDWADCG